MTDDELAGASGGLQGSPINRLLCAYADLLDEIEAHPQGYTWLLDWYYGG